MTSLEVLYPGSSQVKVSLVQVLSSPIEMVRNCVCLSLLFFVLEEPIASKIP